MSRQDAFVQGFACAVATMARSHGHNTEHKEALISCGLTNVDILMRHHVDDFDIEALLPILEEIEAAQ